MLVLTSHYSLLEEPTIPIATQGRLPRIYYTTYVVSITTHTHDRRKSVRENKQREEKKDERKERKEKKTKQNERAKKREEIVHPTGSCKMQPNLMFHPRLGKCVFFNNWR